jgi:DNA-binding transcriptional LysR family regulator
MDGAVRAVADTGEGLLDVSCPGTFTMRWLIPRLYRFRDTHPEIEVRLSASSLPVNFQRDGFDVAIRAGQGDWGADVIATDLFAESTGPVLAPALLHHDPDLSHVEALHTRSRKGAWRAWADRTGRAIPAGNGVEYEHFYYMIEAALSGLGMCIAPWPLVADDVRSGRLVAPYGFTQSGQNYVALRRARPHRKAALFCEWLTGEAHLFLSAAEA